MGTKYASQTVTGYNSSPPADDGSAVGSNQVKWNTVKIKVGDPLNNFATAINSALLTALDNSETTTAVNYTTTAADHLKPVQVTAAATISLGDAATMAAGYIAIIKNRYSSPITVNLATAGNSLDGTVGGSVSVASNSALIAIVNPATNGYDILVGSNIYFRPYNKTASYPAVVGDSSTLFTFNTLAGGVTFTLPAASTLTAGWAVIVKNVDSTNTVTVQKNAADAALTLYLDPVYNGNVTVPLYRDDALFVYFDGTNFIANWMGGQRTDGNPTGGDKGVGTRNTHILYIDGVQVQTAQMAKVWCNYTEGVSPTINLNYNVTSLTRNATGDYTVNFTNAVSSSNHSTIATGEGPTWSVAYVAGRATTSARIGHVNSTGTLTDGVVNMVVFCT